MNGKTYFADEETLAYIRRLEAENKRLREQLAFAFPNLQPGDIESILTNPCHHD